MLDWWAANWEKVIAIVGTLAGVIGCYFGLKGWKRKKPTYLIRSNNIYSGLEHAIPDVEVTFRGYGQPIQALTVTKIAFWNAGSETIKKQDIVKDDPITIQGKPGVVFLSASVIDSVSPLNKIDCKVKADRSQITITFDYLDYNQGANIQVFHTGTSNADITMHGTIMGASPIRRKFRGESTAPPLPIWVGLVPVCVLWTLLGLAAFGLLPTIPDLVQPAPRGVMTVDQAAVGLLILTAAFGLVLYVAHIPKPFSKILRK